MKFNSLVLVFLFGTASLVSSQEVTEVENPKNSLGIETVGLFYNQYVVYYERQLLDHLSINIALGFSPSAFFNSPFSYKYFQMEVRDYFLNNNGRDMYFGFGTAGYFSDQLIDYSKWNVVSLADSSIALGTYGVIGWKFVPPGGKGFFFDPNIYFYTIAPIGISTLTSAQSAPFPYKLVSGMMNIIVGYSF